MKKLTVDDLNTLLGSVHNRRNFMKLPGKMAGYPALASTLGACGGGGGGGSDNGVTGDSNPPAAVIPAASGEYSALKRTSFGAHRDELAMIQSMGVEACLERQLEPAGIDDGDLDTTLQTLFPLTTQNPAQLISGFPDNIADVALQMISATQYRQIFSKRQLYEVMMEFWPDHFNIHLVNGLGPAMLFYLDNYANQASAPNENYARELMELHTLGVDGGYSEADVKEVARCFTGWAIRFPGDAGGDYGTFVFSPDVHDDNAKLVLGNTISAGGGQTDGEMDEDLRTTTDLRTVLTELLDKRLGGTDTNAVFPGFSGPVSANVFL